MSRLLTRNSGWPNQLLHFQKARHVSCSNCKEAVRSILSWTMLAEILVSLQLHNDIVSQFNWALFIPSVVRTFYMSEIWRSFTVVASCLVPIVLGFNSKALAGVTFSCWHQRSTCAASNPDGRLHWNDDSAREQLLVAQTTQLGSLAITCNESTVLLTGNELSRNSEP